MSLRFSVVILTLLPLIPLLEASALVTVLQERFGTFQSDPLIVQSLGGALQETYSNNVNKTWRMTARPGHRVALYFSTFDLEDSYDEDNGGACVYDYIQVEGYRRVCGNQELSPDDAPRSGEVFRSEGDTMVVHFVTDYSNDAEFQLPYGFVAHYYEEDINECIELEHAARSGVKNWDELLYCNHHCHNIPGSYYCTCRPGFTLHSNRHTCVASCESERQLEGEGTVESVEYPGQYGKLSDCETTLRARIGQRIDVRFEGRFEIEDHYEEGCVYDWLKLTNDAGEERVFCGDHLPDNGSWIFTDTSSIMVYFRSDLTLEKAGYRIRYRTHRVTCEEQLRSPINGYISSQDWNGTARYEDRIIFGCNLGFRLVGSDQSMCGDDGSWTSPSPECQLKHCPRPERLLNISRTEAPSFEEHERPFNSSLNISCIEWYELVSGSVDWFCGDDEMWHPRGVEVPNNNDNLPECRPYCGIKNRQGHLDFFSTHILGGRNARYGEWPWMAFISFGRGIEDDRMCGGSLVDDQYVITAAHCLVRPSPAQTRVYLGVTDRFNTTAHTQVFNVMSFQSHSGFGRNPTDLYNNDIAIVKLARPAVIGRYVRPICIPRSPIEVKLPQTSNETGVVIGWGRTADGANAPTARILQQVRVPYVNHSSCLAAYQRQSAGHENFGHVQITMNQLCAGYLRRSRDSCDGDSGGPLMWRNQGRFFLNGIVSFGTKLQSCAQSVLGVYTNTSLYHDFLDTHIRLTP